MRVKAPELSKATDWLNVSQPLTLEMLRGKIVVLDFWTFCCVDCMHILPYLKQLEEKYADVLVVIGVHSAKFPNEKDSTQIRKAIARYGIEHPVANDSRFAVWEDYWIREWPTLVLIDPEGYMCKQIPCSKKPYGQLDEDIPALIEQFEAEGKLNRAPLPFTWGQGSEPGEAQQDNQSLLSYPGKVTTDGRYLYISDTGHNRVIVSELNGRITHVIGNGTKGRQDGSFTECSFYAPQGLASVGSHLFVADTENHLLRRIDLQEQRVTTVAGTGRQSLLSGQTIKIGAALETDLSSPWDLVGIGERIYICMAGPHQIWYYSPETEQVGIFAGNAVESLKDGPVQEANLAQPSGICADNGKLYFADAETSAIRVIDTTDQAPSVKTLVGKGLFEFGDEDGELSKAKLQHPLGVINGDGCLYVADSYNHKIKCIDTANSTISTLAGGQRAGFDDGMSALFAEPGGLTAFDGKIYVADTNNHAIRVIDVDSLTTRTIDLQLSIVGSYKDLTLPNVRHLHSKPVVATPGKPLSIAIDLVLPPQFHLNAEAPLVLNAQSSLFESALADKIHEANTNRASMLTTPLKQGEGTVEVMLQVYYCGDGEMSACRVSSFVWQIPLHTDATAGSDNNLNLEATIVLPESAAVH